MIVARMEKEDGQPSLLLLLEPGNIGKLQLGQPIIKNLKQFMPDLEQDIEIVIGYSPDVQFVADQVAAGESFLDAVSKSMKRKEVYVRPAQAEAVVRVR